MVYGRHTLGLAKPVRKVVTFKLLQSPALSLYRFYSSSFPINDKNRKAEHDSRKLTKLQRWGVYLNSDAFKRSMTKYYVGGFIALCVAWYYYMRDRYYEDKQIQHVRGKYKKDPSMLTEYEYLMLKSLSSEKLRPKEEKKYRIYQLMRKEFRRKHMLQGMQFFNPTPEDLEDWYSKQPRIRRQKAPVLKEQEDELSISDDVPIRNADNPNIMPAEDTTPFYDRMADSYDNAIKWEERGVMMGARRRWLMHQAKGDVLEVACGTGRNIPYFRPDLVSSITFLDSSRNMVSETHKKFRASYPDFRKAHFTVGHAEDLVKIANVSTDAAGAKYDTIIEAFGLCAHEDPVVALRNMSALLKPQGRIILLEHGRSTWSFINNHLDFRSEKRMKTWACRWNLDIAEIIDEAGLDITFEKRVHLGTTYMLVCKRPEDPPNQDEKSFWNKLMGRAPPEAIKRM
ncbi:methyltransferase Oms1p, mitochondrial [Diutina catenulata]